MEITDINFTNSRDLSDEEMEKISRLLRESFLILKGEFFYTCEQYLRQLNEILNIATFNGEITPNGEIILTNSINRFFNSDGAREYFSENYLNIVAFIELLLEKGIIKKHTESQSVMNNSIVLTESSPGGNTRQDIINSNVLRNIVLLDYIEDRRPLFYTSSSESTVDVSHDPTIGFKPMGLPLVAQVIQKALKEGNYIFFSIGNTVSVKETKTDEIPVISSEEADA